MPQAVAEIIQSLTPGTILELFEIDITGITTGADSPDKHIYMHSGVNFKGTAVVWQGKTYTPWPIAASGFDKNGKGTAARPHVTVANIMGTVTALVLQHDDLVGAKVIRRQTYAKYLDAVNFVSNTNPDADPNQHLPDAIYFVERKTSETPEQVSFDLASPMDMEGRVLPSRQVVVDYCPRMYRAPAGVDTGNNCPYAGSSYFDENDAPVGTLALDKCSQTVNGCKVRYPNTSLPFGGFTAARAVNY